MPGWLNKLKDVVVPVAKVTEAVAPGPAGRIAGVVDQALSDKSQPDPDVIKQLTLRLQAVEARLERVEDVLIRRP